jgi:hypothetical protein
MKKRVRKKYPKRVMKWALKFLRDNCQVCHGTRGGQWGNENLVNGVVMCDDCHAEHMYRVAQRMRQP